MSTTASSRTAWSIPAAMHPIMRGGYFDYFHATADTRFQMRRPKGAGEFAGS